MTDIWSELADIHRERFPPTAPGPTSVPTAPLDLMALPIELAEMMARDVATIDDRSDHIYATAMYAIEEGYGSVDALVEILRATHAARAKLGTQEDRYRAEAERIRHPDQAKMRSGTALHDHDGMRCIDAGCVFTPTRQGITSVGVPPPGVVEPAEVDGDERQLWGPVDKTAVLDAVRAGEDLTPETGVLYREDGPGLLYPGKVHIIQGEPESLKSWLCFVTAASVLNAGGRVLWVDLEDDLSTAVLRLNALGVDLDVVDELFDYVQPEVGLLHKGQANLLAQQSLYDHVGRMPPGLIVIDSVSELAALQGLSIDSNDDMTLQSSVIKRLARITGASMVLIDHVTKATDTRAQYSIGAQSKQAALTGAAFIVEMTTPFGHGMVGRAIIKVAKDRAGGIRQYATGHGKIQTVAELVLASSLETGAVAWTLRKVNAGSDGDMVRPTTLMQRASEYLEAWGEPRTKTQITADVLGKKQVLLQAIDFLSEEGFVEVLEGGRTRKYVSKKPYRSAFDEQFQDPDDVEQPFDNGLSESA